MCPADKPVGVYPYCCPSTYEYRDKKCRCPKGAVVIDGLCQVPPKQEPQQQPEEAKPTCPPDTYGIPPICIPQKEKKEKQRPQKHEEPIEQGPPQCPTDRPVGTPPNCCPDGTHFTEGSCYPLTCTPGWTGAPPHCQPPAPAPVQTGPAPKCKSPKIGTPPDCHCPGNLEGENCEFEPPK